MSQEPWYTPEGIRRQASGGDKADPRAGQRDVFQAYRDLAAGRTDAWARHHALMEPELARAYARQARAAAGVSAASILDLGCGPGTVTAALGESFACRDVLGLDASAEAVAFAAKAYASCAFRAGVFEAATELGRTFDLVHCREFYPFTRTADAGLHEGLIGAMARHVAPGGALVVTILDVPESLAGSLPALKARLAGWGLSPFEAFDEASPKLGALPLALAVPLTRALNALRRRPRRLILAARKTA